MINFNLRVLLVVVSALLFVIIFRLIYKGRISIKYSLCWLMASLVILLVGVVPEYIGKITKLIGFETTSNFVIGALLVMLLLISLILTLIVSKQKKSIILLVQEISMLKSEMDQKGERKNG